MNSTCRFTASILLPVIIAALTAASPAARVQTDSKFVFGSKPQRGWTQVSPTNLYSDAAGYGFEPGAEVSVPDGGSCVASDQPVLFFRQGAGGELPGHRRVWRRDQ